MKAKNGFSGLPSFTLSFGRKKPDLWELAGNSARLNEINELFDEGNEEQARKMLRQALAETTRKVDLILNGKQREDDELTLGVASSWLSKI